MRVLFCTEGDARIGFGHVYRSLALAEEIRHTDMAASVMFSILFSQARATKEIRDHGFPVAHSWPNACDVCVVDRHIPEVPTFKNYGVVVNLVDSTEDIPPALSGLKVALMGEPTPDTVIGPEYAILRRSITRAKPPQGEPAYDALLSFGGSDPAGATWQAAEALQHSGLRLAALLGPGFSEPERFIRQYGEAMTVHRTTDPAPLMILARVILCSAGMTLWEALHLGIPSIVISQTGREQARARSMAGQGLCLHLGRADQPMLFAEGARQDRR